MNNRAQVLSQRLLSSYAQLVRDELLIINNGAFSPNEIREKLKKLTADKASKRILKSKDSILNSSVKIDEDLICNSRPGKSFSDIVNKWKTKDVADIPIVNKRTDGNPIEGDKVTQTLSSLDGGQTILVGTVFKNDAGRLRVRVNGETLNNSDSVTYPLNKHWTLAETVEKPA